MIELLIFGLIILSAVCLWILIEERKHPKFLFWFIPVLLIVITSTYVTYTSILGFPKVSNPPEGGIYISHFVDEPYWIYIWVLEKKAPRSYQIVYSRKTHDSLEGVKGEAMEGSYMILRGTQGGLEDGEKNEGSEEGGGFTVGGDISFYKWDYFNDAPQKD
jgi:hypothetical protein